MSAGSLRDRLTILRPSRVSDGKGGFVSGETVVAEGLPAAISVKRGNEQLQASRLSGVTPFEITVRYDAISATITAQDVAVDQNGTRYAIQWAGSLDEGRKRWLTISASTGTVANR